MLKILIGNGVYYVKILVNSHGVDVCYFILEVDVSKVNDGKLVKDKKVVKLLVVIYVKMGVVVNVDKDYVVLEKIYKEVNIEKNFRDQKKVFNVENNMIIIKIVVIFQLY